MTFPPEPTSSHSQSDSPCEVSSSEESSTITPAAPPATKRVSQREEWEEIGYGSAFWLTYAGNAMMMIAVTLFYNFGGFVTYLGGTEGILGQIVATGMIGSLIMRLIQGVGIDSHGPNKIWTFSGVLFILCCLAHIWIDRVDTVWIYLLRIVFSSSIAGIFGASITYISLRSSPLRLPEVLGTLGTSGFIGMIIGSKLGDWLITMESSSRVGWNYLFMLAAAMGALGWFTGWLATRQTPRPRRTRRPRVWLILFRYYPGPILFVGVATGFGIGMPAVFLRTFCESLHIPEMAYFFTSYPITAFIARLSIRRLPERIGIRPTAVTGLVILCLSILSFLTVSTEEHLILPAILMGIAHAMLFPCVVAGGSSVFPSRFRGMGTTMMLASVDLGTLLGGFVIGKLIDYLDYGRMFVAVGVMLSSIALYYGLSRKGISRPGDKLPSARRRRPIVLR